MKRESTALVTFYSSLTGERLEIREEFPFRIETSSWPLPKHYRKLMQNDPKPQIRKQTIELKAKECQRTTSYGSEFLDTSQVVESGRRQGQRR